MPDAIGLAEACETLRFQVLLGLHLDGDAQAASLNHEIDLARAFHRRPVIRVEAAVAHELLAHVLLRHRTFEVREKRVAVDDGERVHLGKRAKEADVDAEELERRLIHVGRQGNPGSRDPLHLDDEAGVDQELQRVV